MARDAQMLEAGLPAARIYRWDGPWVTLGRFQRPERSATGNVPWTIRPTGGKAVLHGHDIVVAVVIPVVHREALAQIYRTLVQPILLAMAQCGVNAELAGGRASETAGPHCFAARGAFDVVDESGNKVAGCALRVTDHAALLQASLPIAPPLVRPRFAILGAEENFHIPRYRGDLRIALKEFFEDFSPKQG